MQNSGQKISGYYRNNPWVSGQSLGKTKNMEIKIRQALIFFGSGGFDWPPGGRPFFSKADINSVRLTPV